MTNRRSRLRPGLPLDITTLLPAAIIIAAVLRVPAAVETLLGSDVRERPAD